MSGGFPSLRYWRVCLGNRGRVFSVWTLVLGQRVDGKIFAKRCSLCDDLCDIRAALVSWSSDLSTYFAGHCFARHCFAWHLAGFFESVGDPWIGSNIEWPFSALRLSRRLSTQRLST